MNTPLHVLLEADTHLEGDLAYGEADPSACHQLDQESDFFEGRLTPWTTNMCLDRLDFF